ncbi:DUF4349 domain-containing protein [Nonomuraea sp. K274]|uniref:DUF4349 domain-containing protein n=1 Tax=Nonomuraea cypriaca TaxID=1187855 RepID=A0A931AHC3_9ACTN|nr:DUF4349 domain-containing protein [Nonomuraea cypriaca]MBF8190150.1 DUF4349 domain-containing protein [Nonomuraea cypriaca]
MRRIRYGIALSATCAAVLLAGCGAGAELQSTSGGPAMASAQAQDQSNYRKARVPQAEKQEQADRAGQAGIVSDVKVTQQDRQVIYTGRTTVRAEQVTAAAAQAKEIATAAGGYLAKEESDAASGTRESATLEFKIPPAKYAEVLGRFGKELGKQISVNQSTQDVTLQMADVESRLKSAQQALDSLRTLLKRADTIGQVLDVEREISTREADLESLQAQQKELSTQVSMATLTLRLVGPAAAVEEPEEEAAGFLGGLRAGWRALVSFAKVLLTVVGAAVPWLIVALPLLALAIYLVRRARTRRPTAPTPPPTGPDPETA